MDIGPKEDFSNEFVFPELVLFDTVEFIYKLPWAITIETKPSNESINCFIEIDF